ncbi:hypothetical protein JTE90_009951 [Oedothorax gibbosus]|uniref:WD repeat-containing protein 89 n=1 Tax=Oedothorax gibbosus TaxID=931172 RepID=A0AAV6V6R2_9ARAC|nr:hypothetical protein JTE90_009951 [Oedothorax gibbosus]
MSITNGKIINGKGVSSKLLLKHKVTEEYILQSAVNNQENAKLAVSLSNMEILYIDNIKKIKTLSLIGHQKSITDLKFSRESPNLLYSSSLDGTILVWDTRSGKTPVSTFLDESDGDPKPILCFDFNVDEKFICGGTELIREDSFIIFWDIRFATNVGGYWNSHTEEITDVQFHSTSNSGLASSSVDGLINIFDLSQSTEDDALVNTLNVETSITSPTLTVMREDLSEKYKEDVDFLIDTFCVENSLYLASGSNVGCVQLYCQKENGLKQISALEDGHTDIVRTISPCQTGILITGGEDGQLCTWKQTF